MKAWFLTKINNIENNPLELKKVKLRSLNDDEVLIKLKEIGICKIDLNLIEGDAVNFGYPSKKPIIPGHEAIGSVEDIGNKVEEFKKGDLVGISMLYSSCGKCKECLSGNESACKELLITGESIDGCYAEYFIGKSNFIFKIPQEISEKAILTVCNLPLVYKSFKLSLRNLEDKIAIYGLNFFLF
jgi:Zn-dependent alcohol dehydrogenases